MIKPKNPYEEDDIEHDVWNLGYAAGLRDCEKQLSDNAKEIEWLAHGPNGWNARGRRIGVLEGEKAALEAKIEQLKADVKDLNMKLTRLISNPLLRTIQELRGGKK